MTTKAADPFSVILRRKKIPMGLLVDSEKVSCTHWTQERKGKLECDLNGRWCCAVQVSRMNLLEAEAFDETFGGKATRKRPKLASLDYESLMQRTEEQQAKYQAPDHT